eukprot:2785478-Amphidinium_carterae.1
MRKERRTLQNQTVRLVVYIENHFNGKALTANAAIHALSAATAGVCCCRRGLWMVGRSDTQWNSLQAISLNSLSFSLCHFFVNKPFLGRAVCATMFSLFCVLRGLAQHLVSAKDSREDALVAGADGAFTKSPIAIALH